mmetsp:Transcript_9167/g.13644  ORF Transcript_9167/g.13644 Transcript_9167/m.13644 type:complete len:209 (-) Transcript_9167:327-953(-)
MLQIIPLAIPMKSHLLLLPKENLLYQDSLSLIKDTGLIANSVHFPSTTASVVQECVVLFKHGDEYDPSRKKYNRHKSRKISPKSFLQHQVAHYSELHSLKTTASIINAMRKLELGPSYELSKHYIGRTAIRNALQSMNCKLMRVKKISQASDKNLHWVAARLNFTAQLCLRFGMDLPPNLDPDIKALPFLDTDALEQANLRMSVFQIG